jgi:hypothetical protein
LQESAIIAGTDNSLPYVNEFLGYDFTPYLPALWDADAPSWIRQDYERALEARLEESYYRQLFDFCQVHQIALTGHPAEPDAMGHLKYFHIPGQDIVWRQIEPNKATALEGRQSTQAKAASSVSLHQKRRRNANEFCGAYGHNLSFDEMRWLAHWLLIRGCNLLIPHAFYYSIRGPRYHERPPDVGLHSAWWETGFTEFAYACRRLAWLNIDSTLVCDTAILGEHHQLPWRAAKDCFEAQIDFNYLDIEDLRNVQILENELRISEQAYSVLIVDSELPLQIGAQLRELSRSVKVLDWSDNTESCIAQLKQVLPSSPFAALKVKALRVRHLRKAGFEWFMLFNEESAPLQFELALENSYVLDPTSLEATAFLGEISLNAYELKLLVRKDD